MLLSIPKVCHFCARLYQDYILGPKKNLLMVVEKIEKFFEILVKIFFKYFEIILLMVVEKIKNDEKKYLDVWRSHFHV